MVARRVGKVSGRVAIRLAGNIAGWLAATAIAYFVAVYVASGVVWLTQAFGGQWSLESTIGLLLYQLVVYVVMVVALGGVMYAQVRSKLPVVAGIQRTMTWRDVGLSLPGFVLYALAAVVALWLASHIPGFPLTESQDLGFSYVFGVDRFVAFVVLVVLTPLFEELVFRGLLYGKLRQYAVPRWVPAVCVSALFGLAHMQWNVAVDAFCLSLMACVLRELTGSIWAGVLLHTIKNLVAFLALFVFVGGAGG